MATTAPSRSNGTSPRTSPLPRLEPVALDRDRAIDAWIAELYQAALRQDGWGSFLVSLAETVQVDPLVVVALADEGRELREFPSLSGAERAALARLAPNLRQARDLRSQLHNLRIERDATSQLLDRIAVGAILVDARGRVIRANRVGQKILELADGLRNREGLEGATPAETTELRESIALAAAAGADPAARERLRLARPSGGRPWMVEMIRVERDTADGATAPAAAVTVLVSDGEQATHPRTEALRCYYELTPAEAELTSLLSQGLSLEEAASKRGVSRNTARGQLKRIFSKTRTNRQAELVGLVLKGPSALS